MEVTLKFVRYDGTPKTLPDVGRLVMLCDEDGRRPISYMLKHVYEGLFLWQCECCRSERKPEKGELWAYWPEAKV